MESEIHLNLTSILVLTVGYGLIWIVFVRAPKKRRVIILLVLLAPMMFFTIRWANYRGSWTELLIAFLFSILLAFTWWLVIGRTLETASDDNIRVWSKDDPFE